MITKIGHDILMKMAADDRWRIGGTPEGAMQNVERARMTGNFDNCSAGCHVGRIDGRMPESRYTSDHRRKLQANGVPYARAAASAGSHAEAIRMARSAAVASR